MVIKSFNVSEDVYRKFSGYCKENGISMSKQVDFMMRSVAEDEPKVRQEYAEKLERLAKGRFVRVEDFAERYCVPSKNRRK